MIAWTEKFPNRLKPLAYFRLLKASYQYDDHLGLCFKKGLVPCPVKKTGDRRFLETLKDSRKGQRGFVLGNGPSLKKMNLRCLKDELTIGSNGVYQLFDEIGFSTDYLLFEDIVQTELRRKDIPKIKGARKLAASYNSYAFPRDEETFFMNVRPWNDFYREQVFPEFSTDFAAIVYLGGTVTYIALQLAFHLGCDPVYLIGVDHSYGDLAQHFPPGKIKITKENIDLVRRCHFSEDYYQIGDVLGVPYVELQNQAYQKARDVFEENGRTLINAGVDSQLDVYPRADFETLFVEKNGSIRQS